MTIYNILSFYSYIIIIDLTTASRASGLPGKVPARGSVQSQVPVGSSGRFETRGIQERHENEKL